MSKAHLRTILVVAISIFLLLGAWGSRAAEADVAKTTKSTPVMQRKGEKSRVLMRIPPGKNVKVLTQEGRWVKVRYQGRTGWVTRSSLSAASVARKTTKTKRKKGFVEGRDKKRAFEGSGPEDRVGADAVTEKGEEVIEDEGEGEAAAEEAAGSTEGSEEETIDEESSARGEGEEASDEGDEGDEDSEDGEGDEDEADTEEGEDQGSDVLQTIVVTASKASLYRRPSSSSKAFQTVTQGAKLVMHKKSRTGSWLLVENADGDQGWILASAVGEPGLDRPKLLIRAGTRAGYTALRQAFVSDGPVDNELANYKIASGAASFGVAGDVMYRVTSSVVVGADLDYTGSYSSPGIAYNGENVAYTAHEVSVGAAAGYDFNATNGMAVYGRAGYHYGKFGVNPPLNMAGLPSEIMSGITLGARMEIPRLSGKIGLRLAGDAMFPAANLTQTEGLRDGNLDSLFAAWVSTLVTYQWSPKISLEAGYRYGVAKAVWTGQSQRPTDAVNQSRRADNGHLLSLGVGTWF